MTCPGLAQTRIAAVVRQRALKAPLDREPCLRRRGGCLLEADVGLRVHTETITLREATEATIRLIALGAGGALQCAPVIAIVAIAEAARRRRCDADRHIGRATAVGAGRCAGVTLNAVDGDLLLVGLARWMRVVRSRRGRRCRWWWRRRWCRRCWRWRSWGRGRRRGGRRAIALLDGLVLVALRRQVVEVRLHASDAIIHRLRPPGGAHRAELLLAVPCRRRRSRSRRWRW